MSESRQGWVALFPGQGSQFVGMGKDFYTEFSVYREALEEASDRIRLDLKKLSFDGPESDLTVTENLQPALVAMSVGVFRILEKEAGFRPEMAAGHSLGEYSALVSAQAIRFERAIEWVRERGKAMQAAVPVGIGGMAAVLGLEDELTLELCKAAEKLAQEKRTSGDSSAEQAGHVDVCLEPANYNAPGQTVIAGSADGLAAAMELTRSDERFKKTKLIPLKVSAPFHCRLMAPARERMKSIFSELKENDRPRPPVCAVVPNRTAHATRESGIFLRLLEEQVDHPVLWKQSLEAILNQGYLNHIEIGPGKVLAGLTKRISAQAGVTVKSLNCGTLEELKNTLKELQ